MNTRIVKTSLWRDNKIQHLSKNSTLLFVYLITNEYINLCGIYELSDMYISLQCKLTKEELDISKKELQDIKVAFFHDGWVFLPNSRRHNKYHKSPKTMTAYRNQVSSIPENIKSIFAKLSDSTMDSSIDSTMDTVSIPIENINKKTENRNQKEEIIKQKHMVMGKMSMNEAVNPEDIPF